MSAENNEIIDETAEAATNEEAVNDEAEATMEEVESAEGESSIEEQLEAALKKADENWDQFLRTRAEMENLRRRSQKDIENAHKYGLEKFILELLPVKESMEMGLTVEEATIESLQEGMQLTLNMLEGVLEKSAVEEIDPKGEKFDPEFHQAMTMVPDPEAEPNTVIDVMQKGYRLNDRLIRPAMVVVSKAPE